jgi:RNA polymerase sigma factor (sigma-70 family)
MSPARRELEVRELYEACAPSSFPRARDLLGNEADAWDIVHKVFCRLAESACVADWAARPMAYVYRATTNACLNELAARRTRKDSLPPARYDVGGHAEAVHARDLLEKLDARMDDLDRRILVLAFHDELPQHQIAEVLGIWRRTVGRRLSRLRSYRGRGAGARKEDLMTEHLSALDLDEVAAGLASDAARRHATRCPDCRGRVARAEGDRRATMTDPRFGIARNRLGDRTDARRWQWKIVGAAAMAAGVALTVFLPQRLHLQAKGGRTAIALVGLDGQPVERPRVGDELEVHANPGRHRYGLVLAIENSPASTTLLWPSGGGESGAIAPGENVSVHVRVTAGATRIVAAFSDRPVSAREVQGAPPAAVDISQLEIVPRPWPDSCQRWRCSSSLPSCTRSAAPR